MYQVFALISCMYQALMNEFARLPSLVSSLAELPDSQLLSVSGKLQFVSCMGLESTRFIRNSASPFLS